MTRNYSRDVQVFDVKEDIEPIAKLYYSHESEVRRFLQESDASGGLEGLTNNEVYELITNNLGYPVPN